MTAKTFAVLIDTDNISPQQIDKILSAVTARGAAMIRRAYGDWSKKSLGWREALLAHAIVPVQQYAYTPGKNATDFALVIDAMDILYRNAVDGFAIISSDSDFTPLTIRLREAGKEVVGIGERQTPAPFREACGLFVELEPPVSPAPLPPAQLVIHPAPSSSISKTAGKKAVQPSTPLPAATLSPASQKPSAKAIPRRQIAATITDLTAKSGRCLLTSLGSELKQRIPGFSHKAYGFSQLSKLLQSCDEFLVSGNAATLMVSVRKTASLSKTETSP